MDQNNQIIYSHKSPQVSINGNGIIGVKIQSKMVNRSHDFEAFEWIVLLHVELIYGNEVVA